MEYPLELSFKILAMAPQIRVTDAHGRLLFYVKQKLFKLKEAVTVFVDESQTQPLFQINADRVLDFSARYHFTAVNGADLGSVKREGVKSLWRSHYEIFEGGAPVMTIREEDPWVKVLDGLLDAIPIVSLFSGYVFNPTFLVSYMDGTPVMRLAKQPAFFESKFAITRLAALDEQQETRVLLSLIMMVLLERARG
jgi:hypothetical protein